MSKKILQKAVMHGLRFIESAVIDFQKRQDPEALHQLRVQIKIVRSIRSFLEFTQEELLDLSALKPLYQQAGSLRELHLNMEWSEEGIAFPASRLKKMMEMEEQQKDKFLRKIPEYLAMLKIVRDQIVVPDALPDKEKIRAYSRNKLNELFWLERVEDPKEMHRFRKKIKELLYVMKVLPEKIQEDLNIDQKFLDKVQRKAGIWHDAYIGLQFASSQRQTSEMKRIVKQMTEKERKHFAALLKYRSKINKMLIGE